MFFFSSRRRHTRYWRDWSSDVCSSDLRQAVVGAGETRVDLDLLVADLAVQADQLGRGARDLGHRRSEERREGKSVDLGGRRIIKKKKKHADAFYISRLRSKPYILNSSV